MNPTAKTSSPPNPPLELLEPRTFMSAAWTTVDRNVLPYEVGPITGMASDHAGNVYMSGSSTDTAGNEDVFVREMAAGTGTWTTIFQTVDPGYPETNELATDAAGNLFLGGNQQDGNVNDWVVREKLTGQSTFSIIDTVANAVSYSLTTDGAGDVYGIGQMPVTTTTKGRTTTTEGEGVRELVPTPNGFTGRTLYASTSTRLDALTEVDSGASAGVYVAAQNSNNDWIVLKGVNGGQSWSQVDQFHYDPSISGGGTPVAMIADTVGNLYVAGYAVKKTITGYTTTTVKGKTTQTPVYSNVSHWLVRKGVNGGTSWSTDDDYQLDPVESASATALGIDLAGNVYAVGSGAAPYNANVAASHAIVRTNAGGSWATIDDYTDGLVTRYGGFATGSDGTLYAVGRAGSGANQNFFVRSAAGPAQAATTNVVSAMSMTSISGATNNASTDVSGLLELLHQHGRRLRT